MRMSLTEKWHACIVKTVLPVENVIPLNVVEYITGEYCNVYQLINEHRELM